MIHQLSLKNFQSHPDSLLEFHPGVNVIVGSSDSGKSAILRALYWARYNRPLGDSFVSYFNRDGKGGPIRPTRVEVRFGSDSHWLSRIRSKDFNGYAIHSKEAETAGTDHDTLEAVKGDVPEIIEGLFNLSEVNIQKQMDAPFLLSESAGEVARFFNRIIRLDVIDRVLSDAESRKRKYKAAAGAATDTHGELEKELEKFGWIEAAETLLKQLEKANARAADRIETARGLRLIKGEKAATEAELEKLTWIPRAEKLLERARRMREDAERETERARRVRENVREGRRTESVLAELKNVKLAETLYDTVVSLYSDISEKRSNAFRLRSLIKEGKEARAAGETGAWLKTSEKILAALDRANEARRELKVKRSALREFLEDAEESRRAISELTKTVSALTASLPSICPTCGAPIKQEGA